MTDSFSTSQTMPELESAKKKPASSELLLLLLPLELLLSLDSADLYELRHICQHDSHGGDGQGLG
jgi:hypothetical protein